MLSALSPFHIEWIEALDSRVFHIWLLRVMARIFKYFQSVCHFISLWPYSGSYRIGIWPFFEMGSKKHSSTPSPVPFRWKFVSYLWHGRTIARLRGALRRTYKRVGSGLRSTYALITYLNSTYKIIIIIVGMCCPSLPGHTSLLSSRSSSPSSPHNKRIYMHCNGFSGPLAKSHSN